MVALPIRSAPPAAAPAAAMRPVAVAQPPAGNVVPIRRAAAKGGPGGGLTVWRAGTGCGAEMSAQHGGRAARPLGRRRASPTGAPTPHACRGATCRAIRVWRVCADALGASSPAGHPPAAALRRARATVVIRCRRRRPGAAKNAPRHHLSPNPNLILPTHPGSAPPGAPAQPRAPPHADLWARLRRMAAEDAPYMYGSGLAAHLASASPRGDDEGDDSH